MKVHLTRLTLEYESWPLHKSERLVHSFDVGRAVHRKKGPACSRWIASQRTQLKRCVSLAMKMMNYGSECLVQFSLLGRDDNDLVCSSAQLFELE